MSDYLLGLATLPALGVVTYLILSLPRLWHLLGRVSRVITAWNHDNDRAQPYIYDTLGAAISASHRPPLSLQIGGKTLIVAPRFDTNKWRDAAQDLRDHGVHRPVSLRLAIPAASADLGPEPVPLDVLDPVDPRHHFGALTATARKVRAVGHTTTLAVLVTPGDSDHYRQALIAIQHHAHEREAADA